MADVLLINSLDHPAEKIDRLVQAIPKGVNYLPQSSQHFFNYKKKKWILLWSILMAIIIFIVIKLLLNISFVQLFRELSKKSNVSFMFATIAMGFLTFVTCEIFMRIRTLKERLKTSLNHVTRFEWLGFSIISFVIQSITPFSLGSEPYSIWWLHKKGIPLRKASIVVSVNSICWFAGQFLITWPSFIYFVIQNSSGLTSWPATYWLVLTGLFVDMLVFLFIATISYSQKAHSWIFKINNSIKKKIGLPYVTEADLIINSQQQRGQFQKMYKRYLFHKSTLKVIAWYLFNNVWTYILFVLIHRLFTGEASSWTIDSAINSYNLINISTTATNFVPLPSSEGSLQPVISSLLHNSVHEKSDHNEEIIFIWRFLCKYFGLFLSMIFIILFGINTRNKKDILKKFKFLKKYIFGTNRIVHHNLIL